MRKRTLREIKERYDKCRFSFRVLAEECEYYRDTLETRANIPTCSEFYFVKKRKLKAIRRYTNKPMYKYITLKELSRTRYNLRDFR